MIGVVTDSTCQLTADQAGAAGIEVVPIIVRIDGNEFREGVELDTDDFYRRLAGGVDGISLSTSQPSPGDFARVYDRLVGAGAEAIVSVHLDETVSGTLNAARVASRECAVPVHLVDARTTSYGLGVVALAVADHVRTGGIEGLTDLVDRLAPHIETVFILGDLRYVMRGGRMRVADLPGGSDEIPVLGGAAGNYRLVGTGHTVEELVELMAAHLLDGEHARHVAIALAAPETLDFTEGLERRMHESPLVHSVHRYRMGPSIAVHTGPGTAGGFAWRA